MAGFESRGKPSNPSEKEIFIYLVLHYPVGLPGLLKTPVGHVPPGGPLGLVHSLLSLLGQACGQVQAVPGTRSQRPRSVNRPAEWSPL